MSDSFQDPYPYRIRVLQHLLDPSEREEVVGLRDGERISDPSWTTFWDPDMEECVFDPRY